MHHYHFPLSWLELWLSCLLGTCLGLYHRERKKRKKAQAAPQQHIRKMISSQSQARDLMVRAQRNLQEIKNGRGVRGMLEEAERDLERAIRMLR